MAYKVTIEQIEVKPLKTREWVRVDNYVDESGEKKQYDYRDLVKDTEVKTTVYEQVVEVLLIKNVIDAVNEK